MKLTFTATGIFFYLSPVQLVNEISDRRRKCVCITESTVVRSDISKGTNQRESSHPLVFYSTLHQYLKASETCVKCHYLITMISSSSYKFFWPFSGGPQILDPKECTSLCSSGRAGCCFWPYILYRSRLSVRQLRL